MNTVHDSSLDDLYHCLRVVSVCCFYQFLFLDMELMILSPAVRDDEDAQQVVLPFLINGRDLSIHS